MAESEKQQIQAAFEQQQKKLRELAQANPALKDLELAKLALAPVGRTVVDKR